MKINWFSPLPPASTDIAHYTTRVLPALSAKADITLWTDQQEWERGLEAHAHVRRYKPESIAWPELNRADLCVYHIGNNPLFHGSIWQLSRQHRGLIVLHDLRLHHFFDGLYRVKWRDLEGYLAVMERYYGDEGRLDAELCYRSEAVNINEMAERYPLTKLATENALGVLVHTREAFELLKAESLCPVAYAPLPFSAATGPARVPTSSQSEAPDQREQEQIGPDERGTPRDGSPYRLILFGYLGRNRRLSAVLKALAELPQKEKFHLDIYGQVLDDQKRLRSEIRALGLKRLVTVHGFVPETELDQALAHAHLAINLRYPTMGEASGSQLRIWAHALPSLVTKVGWYASLPSETVAFVRPRDEEVEDIKSHLGAFLSQPERFRQMGLEGKRKLLEEHSPESYARAILDFAAARFGTRMQARLLAQRAGTLTGGWLQTESQTETFRHVAAEIRAMMGNRRSDEG
jgi:glycosyltransferase involved in cell wall biosynthesis